MEILHLEGFKQTVYFDTGRLQGYPLCEIDFFHFLIGFSIRDWSIEMWEGLPQTLVTPKNWSKKNGYPQKNCYPKKMIKKKLVTPKILAYFIARGFIILFLEKWRTLFCTGLLMRFKHYVCIYILYIYILYIYILYIYTTQTNPYNIWVCVNIWYHRFQWITVFFLLKSLFVDDGMIFRFPWTWGVQNHHT